MRSKWQKPAGRYVLSMERILLRNACTGSDFQSFDQKIFWFKEHYALTSQLRLTVTIRELLS